MEVFRTKAAAYSGTAVNYETQCSYETGNIGACKIWHGITHARTKGGGNKGRRYTSTYAPWAYRNTTSER